ncbi:SgcJ/EcaC family oxidoreductase [Candidatus Uhrbacteria bacterium]|nr:SgcJ/EcaC family oxidoreductase [Candidatus Uhrbacteria bacterium]
MGHDLSAVADKNFAAWNGALLGGDPERVASLYGEECSFLPTMAGDFRQGRERAAGYFRHFLERHPSGTVVEGRVQALGEGTYIHAGLYDFEVDGRDGGRETVRARFTFVWRLDGDRWSIVHHHSSALPQAAA